MGRSVDVSFPRPGLPWRAFKCRRPVLEAAFALNLAKILRAAKASSSSLVSLDDGGTRTAVALTETRLALHLGGHLGLGILDTGAWRAV